MKVNRAIVLQRTGVLLLGALAALVVLELMLRFLGFVYLMRVHADKRGRTAGTTTVLCLGDSYTFGMGAPQDKSYPRQLEQMLNASGQGRKYVVVNRGEPAQNSARLIQALPENLDTIRPDFVVVMSGLNNIWNLKGYSDYLHSQEPGNRFYSLLHHVCVFRLGKLLYYNVVQKRQGVVRYPWVSEVRSPEGASPSPASPPSPAVQGASRDTLTVDEKAAVVSQGARAAAFAALGQGERAEQRGDTSMASAQYRLSIAINPYRREAHLRTAQLRLAAGDESGAVAAFEAGLRSAPHEIQLWCDLLEFYRRTGQSEKALAVARRGVAANPQGASLQEWLGEMCMDLQKLDEAEAAYLKAFEITPDTRNTQFLGGFYKTRKQPTLAIKYLTKAVEINPEDASRTTIPCLMTIFEDYKLVQERDAFLDQLQKSHPDLARGVTALKAGHDLKSGTNQWIMDDYAAIARMCKERRIPLILSNYPMSFDLEGDGTQVVDEAARRLDLPVVDNYRVFAGLRDSEAYFAPDGHCNERGYEIVARNIMQKILELQGAAR